MLRRRTYGIGLARKGADDLLHAFGLKQSSEPRVAIAGVVVHDGEIFRPPGRSARRSARQACPPYRTRRSSPSPHRGCRQPLPALNQLPCRSCFPRKLGSLHRLPLPAGNLSVLNEAIELKLLAIMPTAKWPFGEARELPGKLRTYSSCVRGGTPSNASCRSSRRPSRSIGRGFQYGFELAMSAARAPAGRVRRSAAADARTVGPKLPRQLSGFAERPFGGGHDCQEL